MAMAHRCPTGDAPGSARARWLRLRGRGGWFRGCTGPHVGTRAERSAGPVRCQRLQRAGARERRSCGSPAAAPGRPRPGAQPRRRVRAPSRPLVGQTRRQAASESATRLPRSASALHRPRALAALVGEAAVSPSPCQQALFMSSRLAPDMAHTQFHQSGEWFCGRHTIEVEGARAIAVGERPGRKRHHPSEHQARAQRRKDAQELRCRPLTVRHASAWHAAPTPGMLNSPRPGSASHP